VIAGGGRVSGGSAADSDGEEEEAGELHLALGCTG
jgi:hypothetical protein